MLEAIPAKRVHQEITDFSQNLCAHLSRLINTAPHSASGARANKRLPFAPLSGPYLLSRGLSLAKGAINIVTTMILRAFHNLLNITQLLVVTKSILLASSSILTAFMSGRSISEYKENILMCNKKL